MTLKTQQLQPLGVEILDVDAELLLSDAVDPKEIEALLEQNGIVLFRELNLDDEQLVAFGRRFGELVPLKSGNPDTEKEKSEVYTVSLDPELNDAVYLRATFNWHIDDATRETLIPSKASFLTAKALPEDGGTTYFASTYRAYDQLTDEEKEQFEQLRVVHSLEAAWRHFDPDPSEDVLRRLRMVPPPTHPLVWKHRDGRKSLVIGTTASHVVGMDEDDSTALLEGLLERSTAPELVYGHDWSVGDLVIWDNRGVLHRARRYEATSGRLMHRVTLVGDEPIA